VVWVNPEDDDDEDMRDFEDDGPDEDAADRAADHAADRYERDLDRTASQ
jgi:hypothetical protein